MARGRCTSAWWLVAMLSAIGSTAHASPFDGVTFATKCFELVKREAEVRSASNPGGAQDSVASQRQTVEIQAGLAHLAGRLDGFVTKLREPNGPYPLLSAVVLEYRQLRPMEENEANGRMYAMYLGELHWPFPAPLLADLIRLRVTYACPQAVRDLLTVALMRWGRDNFREVTDQSKAEGRRELERQLEVLSATAGEYPAWQRDRAVRELGRASLSGAHVAKLTALTATPEPAVRAAAVEVLAQSGQVSDPAFFGHLLEDPDLEVSRAAFWGLLFMPGRAGLTLARAFPRRAELLAARLRQARSSVTDEQVALEVTRFDALLDGLASGDRPSPPKPIDATRPEKPVVAPGP